MSTGQLYRARFAFQGSDKNTLSFVAGETFTVISQPDNNWLKVRSVSGEEGFAPISYLQRCPAETPAEVRNDGTSQGVRYRSLYNYTPNSPQQLRLSKGQELVLVEKTNVTWWKMLASDGHQGLVPVNYIDALSEDSSHSSEDTPPSRVNGSDTNEGFYQALASIDANIDRIHSDAALQGGVYTAEQKSLLKSLVHHRQAFLSSHSASAPPPSHSHSQSLPDVSSSPLAASPATSPLKIESPVHQSPLPKRHAPLPPTAGMSSRSLTQQSGSMDGGVVRRKGQGRSCQEDQTQHYSMYVQGSRRQEGRPETNHRHSYYNSLPRRKAPPPPTAAAPTSCPTPHSSVNATPTSSSTHTYRDKQYYTLQRENQSAGPSPSSSPQRRRSASNISEEKVPSSPGKSRRGSQPSPLGSPQHSPRRRQSRKSSKRSSPEATPSSPITPPSSSAARSRTSSKSETAEELPLSSSTHSNSTETAGSNSKTDNQASSSTSPSTHQEALPTSFSVKQANQVVESVRSKVGITHQKAQIAVGVVMEFLKEHAPASSDMTDSLMQAIGQAQLESDSSNVSSKHKDLQRLQEIFFELTDCKDDSQQRGWAVHDDEGPIMTLLEELLQILCDANPEVSKLAIMEDKYENILTLITYYQMEPRVSLRLLLLKVFGVLCGLDRTVVGILLASVLPNELGRDIQHNTVSELQKTLYSCTVCTMIFSTAEPVPLSVYDQWSEDFVLYLMETIEEPPDEDLEDQLPDSFVNLLLAFNQHFPEPESNLVMKALRRNHNPRNLGEKLMYLVNRGEDPVAIADPCCPDSMTKFLLDVFSDRETSGLFYTTDMMVLLDIVTRQLTDLCPGMEILINQIPLSDKLYCPVKFTPDLVKCCNTHCLSKARMSYLELLYRIVGSTDYLDHCHRQSDLVSCLNRIASEEGSEGSADREVVRKIWKAYPQVFQEVTDL